MNAETLRHERLVILNVDPGDRTILEQRHGQVWNPGELALDYIVLGYLAPLVVVRRKTDNLIGSLEFQHNPRYYFNWKVDE